jgi:hypothetical protein
MNSPYAPNSFASQRSTICNIQPQFQILNETALPAIDESLPRLAAAGAELTAFLGAPLRFPAAELLFPGVPPRCRQALWLAVAVLPLRGSEFAAVLPSLGHFQE